MKCASQTSRPLAGGACGVTFTPDLDPPGQRDLETPPGKAIGKRHLETRSGNATWKQRRTATRMGGVRPNDRGRAEVLRVREHPAVRRRGVGGALMREWGAP